MKRRDFIYLTSLAGLSISLKKLIPITATNAQLPPLESSISFDRKSLFINAERKFILSGSVHYFRLPSPEQWESRIKKLKQLGFNAIDVYYFWGYHSPKEGEYDFKGSRNIELFMDIIEAENMFLIARPGPYICAEVDGGGFPGWLIARKDLALRCRKNGKFFYDPEYMKYVRQWYEEIIPRIVKRKNLILLQVENEYGLHFTPRGFIAQLQGAIQNAFGDDFFMRISTNPAVTLAMAGNKTRAMKRTDYAEHNHYIKELYGLARSLGCRVPVFHNDVGDASKRYVDVDIPAIDNYPITNMKDDWKKVNPFRGIDVFEQGLDALKINCPLFAAEIQGGFYDLWGGYGFEHIRKFLGPLAMDMTLKSCLAQGVSILNIYMAAGGTNWGYIMSPDNYTSYDYGAPITESGRISERGYACKKFSEFVKEYEKDLLESSSVYEYSKNGGEIFCKIRKAPSGKAFAFIRNLSGKKQRIINEFGEFESDYPGMQIYVLDRAGKILASYPSYDEPESEPIIQIQNQLKISEFKFQLYTAPFQPDDRGWIKIDTRQMDIDSLGIHYGFVWYRTRFNGKMDWLKIDARHCFAVYLNGEFIRAYDNFKNRVGAGEDLAKSIKLNIPQKLLKDHNNLVILVESLGHNKGFMEDAQNPRGIVKFDSDRKDLVLEMKPGMVPGETGITPKVEFNKILSNPIKINLPHKQNIPAGLGLYQAYFYLDLKADTPGIGVNLSHCSGKANIYINGWLIGRYWHKLGPQKLFYLPPDLLNINGKNELMILVWTWSKEIELGEVKLKEYP